MSEKVFKNIDRRIILRKLSQLFSVNFSDVRVFRKKFLIEFNVKIIDAIYFQDAIWITLPDWNYTIKIDESTNFKNFTRCALNARIQ